MSWFKAALCFDRLATNLSAFSCHLLEVVVSARAMRAGPKLKSPGKDLPRKKLVKNPRLWVNGCLNFVAPWFSVFVSGGYLAAPWYTWTEMITCFLILTFEFNLTLSLSCNLCLHHERTATMEEHKSLDRYFDTAFSTKVCSVLLCRVCFAAWIDVQEQICAFLIWIDRNFPPDENLWGP